MWQYLCSFSYFVLLIAFSFFLLGVASSSLLFFPFTGVQHIIRPEPNQKQVTINFKESARFLFFDARNTTYAKLYQSISDRIKDLMEPNTKITEISCANEPVRCDGDVYYLRDGDTLHIKCA